MTVYVLGLIATILYVGSSFEKTKEAEAVTFTLAIIVASAAVILAVIE